MTPKEQQLAEHILDLAIASHNPSDIHTLVGSYAHLSSCVCHGSFLAPEPVGESDARIARAIQELDAAEAGQPDEAPKPAEVDPAATTPVKTRKPRASKTETPAPAAEPEEVKLETVDPAGDDDEPVKTYAEKIAEAKKLFLDHQNTIVNDTVASNKHKAEVMLLVEKHGGQRISSVPESTIDAFLADLKAHIAA